MLEGGDSDPLVLDDPMVPVGRVLSTWHQEAPYVSSSGEPRPLLLKDFEALVEQHRGDVPVQTIVKELKSAGAIHISGGIVEARARFFMPLVLEEQALERLGRVLGDVGSAISHNLLVDERSCRTFEGRAVSELVSEGAADAFRRYLDRSGQRFLENVDDWLTDHAERGDEPTVRLGVGIYTIGDIE